MISIFKKDFRAYLSGGVAWAAIAIFSIISTLFLFFFENSFNLFDIGSASMQPYFALSPWLLLFIIPVLSMKSFAEEQQNGTLYWLFSQPVSTLSLVVGKWAAVFVVGLLCLLPSCVIVATLSNLSVTEDHLDMGMMWGGYGGLLLLIAAFSGVGIWASSHASNQMMAYLMGTGANFILYFGIEQLASYKLLGSADYWLQNFGFYYHYMSFTRGLVDSRDVSYFLLVLVLSLGATYYFINKKKS
ncbi:ABC transporter permease subunit [Riemerella columbina]|uniref:ABC transporter permease subunit n=1 Tax=Riemerella columbina TaxID=103810 RepID=UPI00266F9DC8|nr:ABC transporter permease subunit [Riemerella columbina]WKS94839.1 ABC transporter permease subunit [Riemerella columbina]